MNGKLKTMRKRITKSLIERFKAETPAFFKWVRNTSLTISGLCGTFILTYTQLPSEFSGFVSSEYLKIITFATLITALLAQLTKKK